MLIIIHIYPLNDVINSSKQKSKEENKQNAS